MSNKGSVLSKDALYILGIIADSPINPYTICKLINYKRKSFKSPIPLQTVYSTVKALHAKKLITFKVIKNAKIPYKTNYSITSKGKEALKKGMLSFLNEPEDPFSQVHVALTVMAFLLYTGDLDKEAALSTLKRYREKIKREITTGRKLLATESDSTVADHILMGIRNSHKRLTNDLATVNQFIEKLDNTSQWDYSPIPFWRDELVNNEKH